MSQGNPMVMKKVKKSCKTEVDALRLERVGLQEEPIASTSKQASLSSATSSSASTSKVIKSPRKRKARKEPNVLDGYTWISGHGAGAIFECDACPAKVMSDELHAHDILHEELGRGIRCAFCRVFVHFDQIFDHRKYECPECPDGYRFSMKDARERYQREQELYSKKKKEQENE